MKTMTSQNYDAIESLARERQSRNLKMANDARLLSGLSSHIIQARSNKGSITKSGKKLSNLPASLFQVIKCQPA